MYDGTSPLISALLTEATVIGETVPPDKVAKDGAVGAVAEILKSASTKPDKFCCNALIAAYKTTKYSASFGKFVIVDIALASKGEP